MPKQEITQFIQQSLAKGVTREKIYTSLLSSGWSLSEIEAGFNVGNQEQKKEHSRNKVINIIVTIGAILISAGVFSFIASNWQYMGRPLKVGVIIVMMLLSYLLGWYFFEKKGKPITGGALIILGAMIYGAGIFLVGQMFNIRQDWPDGFILWMLGVLIMAYLADLFFLYYLAIIISVIAAVSHPIWLLAGVVGSVFIMTSTILLFITAVITFIIAIKVRRQIPSNLKDYY